MHRETGAYHKKFLGHNQKWLTGLLRIKYKYVRISAIERKEK